MTKTAADYLGKPYYPEYRGAFHGELPHMSITSSNKHITVQRFHFHPDNFNQAWEEACNIADDLNAKHTQ